MKNIIAYPESKQQLIALKAVMKALKVKFEEVKSFDNAEFIAKIGRSIKQFENDDFKR